MIQIQCSHCHEPRWMQNRLYRVNCQKFKVTNKVEFNKIYICRKCRKKYRDNTNLRCLYSSPQYRTLQKVLQEQVDLAISRGINDVGTQQNLAINIKKILVDNYKIINYSYDVVNSELKGIILKDIPFFDNIYVKLNSQRK